MKVEAAIRNHLAAGHGILKVAKLVGVGSGTVQRIKKEMAAQIGRGCLIQERGEHRWQRRRDNQDTTLSSALGLRWTEMIGNPR